MVTSGGTKDSEDGGKGGGRSRVRPMLMRRGQE